MTMNNLKKEVSLNLAENPSWPMFSERPDIKGSALSAYTLNWRIADDDENVIRNLVSEQLTRRILRAVSELKWCTQIFSINATIQPRAATVLYRKIWKSLPMNSKPGEVECGAEGMIECVGGVRFASLATIPLSAITWMISIPRRFDLVVPLLLPNPINIHDESAVNLARLGFPPDGCRSQTDIDWPLFCRFVASKGGCCVRISRNQDFGSFEVDFFSSTELIPELVRCLGNDNCLDVISVH